MKTQNITRKPIIVFGGLAIATGCLLAAGADLKTEVKSAAKKLAEKGNYSWTSTTKNEAAGTGQQRPQMAPITGKTDKEGYIYLTMKRADDTTFEAVVKGEKIVVKTEEGWQTGEELRQSAAGGQGRGRGGMARNLQNTKPPAVEAGNLADKAKELTKAADGCYCGDLSEDSAKELLMRGRGGRGGQTPPPPVGAKATVKFWLKEGALVKYECNVQGKITMGQQEREVNRTTTVELKDVGTTKLEVPEEAKKKLS